MNIANEVLELLQKDATLSHAHMAAMIGTDEKTVTDTIAKLEDDGVILKYVAVVNAEKIETGRAEALIELKVSPQRDFGYDDIARRVYKFPEVEAVYLMSGTYDLAVKIEAPTMKDISKFVWEKLAIMDGITSTVTLFIMRKYKENGIVLINEEKGERLVITP